MSTEYVQGVAIASCHASGSLPLNAQHEMWMRTWKNVNHASKASAASSGRAARVAL